MRFFVIEEYRFIGTDYYRVILNRTLPTEEGAKKVLSELYSSHKKEIRKLKRQGVYLSFYMQEEQPHQTYRLDHDTDEDDDFVVV